MEFFSICIPSTLYLMPRNIRLSRPFTDHKRLSSRNRLNRRRQNHSVPLLRQSRRMVIAPDIIVRRVLRREIHKVRFSPDLRNGSLNSSLLVRLLRRIFRRIIVSDQRRGCEEELGVGVFTLDRLCEFDEGRGVGCHVEQGAGLEGFAAGVVGGEAEVVGAEVYDDDVDGVLEVVAVVGVVGAVARPERWEGGLAVVAGCCHVVAEDAFAAPGYDAVVCGEVFGCQGAVGLRCVFEVCGVGARVYSVEAVPDADRVADDLDSFLWLGGGGECSGRCWVADEDAAEEGFGFLADFDGVDSLGQSASAYAAAGHVVDGGHGSVNGNDDGVGAGDGGDGHAGRSPSEGESDAGSRPCQFLGGWVHTAEIPEVATRWSCRSLRSCGCRTCGFCR
jgi:hypothetical protein